MEDIRDLRSYVGVAGVCGPFNILYVERPARRNVARITRSRRKSTSSVLEREGDGVPAALLRVPGPALKPVLCQSVAMETKAATTSSRRSSSSSCH